MTPGNDLSPRLRRRHVYAAKRPPTRHYLQTTSDNQMPLWASIGPGLSVALDAHNGAFGCWAGLTA